MAAGHGHRAEIAVFARTGGAPAPGTGKTNGGAQKGQQRGRDSV